MTARGKASVISDSGCDQGCYCLTHNKISLNPCAKLLSSPTEYTQLFEREEMEGNICRSRA